jgi:hypothetical protein
VDAGYFVGLHQQFGDALVVERLSVAFYFCWVQSLRHILVIFCR